MDNFEVFSYVDKAQRDSNYDDLRLLGNETEKRVVKFSSVEPLLNPLGQQLVNEKGRKLFRSVWLLAHPKKLSGRKNRHPKIWNERMLAR